MKVNIIVRNIVRFVFLMLLQVVILNNLYLGGYITPFLFVLFIAMLPTNTGRLPMLLISFACGLCMDIFSNMMGFHAFCCTLVGFLRVMGADKILLHNNKDVVETPSIFYGSFQQFTVYLIFLLLVYNLVYYTLSIFSLHEILYILISTLLGTLITWVLALLYQALLMHRTKE